MREFKGRVVVPGTVEAEALVSKIDFNIKESFKKALASSGGIAFCSDPVSEDIYRKEISSMALCLTGLTEDGGGKKELERVCYMECNPGCMLFADSVSFDAQGLTMPVIDGLGSEFIDFVKDGMTVTVKEDGIVEVDEEIKPTKEEVRKKKRKKALIIYGVSFVIACIIALGMYFLKDKPTEDIIDYTNNDMKKVNALFSETIDVLKGASKCKNASEYAQYYEKELLPIYDEILDECKKVEYETKEVEKLHGIYVELIKKEKQAYEVYADAMKTVDEKGFEKSDKLFDEASKISDKYMSLKKEYGKKYGLSFTKKK